MYAPADAGGGWETDMDRYEEEKQARKKSTILNELSQLFEILHLDKPVILDEITEPEAQEEV